MSKKLSLEELRESNPFADGDEHGFNRIDLTGFPTLQEQENPVGSEIDDRFAPLDSAGKGAGSAALKGFIRDASNNTDVLQELAARGDAKAVNELFEIDADREAKKFLKMRPRYAVHQDNFERLVELVMDAAGRISTGDVDEDCAWLQQNGYWSAENLAAVYDAALENGDEIEEDYGSNEPRALLPRDRTVIARIAQSSIDQALSHYLRATLSEDDVEELRNLPACLGSSQRRNPSTLRLELT